MRRFGMLVGACLLAGLAGTGCTAQLWYASGQSWQRNECFKLVDSVRRNQCLQRTWVPYDQYERELHADETARAQAGPI